MKKKTRQSTAENRKSGACQSTDPWRREISVPRDSRHQIVLRFRLVWVDFGSKKTVWLKGFSPLISNSG